MELIIENGFFTFQMEKLKQKENSEMVKELENGGIIMSLVGLSRYQAILNLVRGRENGLNMMKMGKNQKLQFTSRINLGIVA
jgi:hypothetical protein